MTLARLNSARADPSPQAARHGYRTLTDLLISRRPQAALL